MDYVLGPQMLSQTH